ncbi:hypothetical protein [Streptomyces sp. B8F3]
MRRGTLDDVIRDGATVLLRPPTRRPATLFPAAEQAGPPTPITCPRC